MRVCLLILCVAFATVAPDQSVLAGDKPAVGPGVTTDYPFLEALPSLNRGRELGKRVAKGEEDAIKEFRASGLTWITPVSWEAPGHTELIDAYLRNWDWIEAMQGWEACLVNSTPAEVMAKYKSLERRFRVPEAALARAILYAWRYGDTKTRDELVKLAPNSKWVAAAQGFMCEGMDPKQAIAKLLPILTDADRARMHRIQFVPHRMKPAAERGDTRDKETRKQDAKDLNSPSSIFELHIGPSEWRFALLYERIGALANETADQAFIADTEKKITEHLKKRGEDDSTPASELVAYQLAAWSMLKDHSAVSPVVLEPRAAESTGLTMVTYGLLYPREWQWQERTLASIAAWHGMPDISLCRRNFLARSLTLNDWLLTRLSARSVLAFYDDDLCGYRDVGRALMRFSKDSALTAEYAKVLAATKHKELVALSQVITKGDPAPLDAIKSLPLGLKPELKAAVLAAFSEQAERDAHGGALGVYWLNRAVFHEAARKLATATDAHWEAMQAQEAAKKTPDITANVLQYAFYVERNLLPAQSKQVIEARRTKHKDVAAKVDAALADSQDPKGSVSSKIFFALAKANARESFDDELYREMTENPFRWGGTGRILAADNDFHARRFTNRRTQYEAAIRTSPLCYQVNLRPCPEDENFGTLSAANWHVAAVHSMALAMISPYSMDTLGCCGAVLLLSGCAPISLASLSTAGLSRPCAIQWRQQALFPLMLLGHRRHHTWRVIHRHALADSERISAERLAIYEAIAFELMYCYQSDKIMSMLCVLQGPTTDFTSHVIGSYQLLADMSDVNNLLNYAINTCFVHPEQALAMVQAADSSGVSSYGHFVGTQAYIAAMAQTGKLADALDRYRKARGGRAGFPPYLDNYLLGGLTRGNNYAEAAAAIDAISDFDLSRNNNPFHFLWRRVHMMAGKHSEIANLNGPENSPIAMEDGEAFSLLFHEARALLESADFEVLAERTKPYLEFTVEAGMGVYLDAALLQGIATKLSGGEVLTKGKLNVITPELADAFLGGEAQLDSFVFEILCGRSSLKEVPAIRTDLLWHASHYGERTPTMGGSGRMTQLEVRARDWFVRGVIAWLHGDNAKAKSHLEECVKCDQRSSHDYHVAEWMLANPLKK